MPELTEESREISRSRPEDILYDALKARINEFALKPGEMLSENSLSLQADVSRSVVRSALSRLLEEGYVKVFPQRGTYVALIDEARVRQAVRVHIILEVPVIEDLCRRGLTDKEAEKLTQLAGSMQLITDESDIPYLIEQERELHWLLLTIDDKTFLQDYFRTLDCDMARIRYLQYATFNYRESMSSLTTWEHAKTEGKLLIDNILRREASSAALVCSNHFNSILLNMETIRAIYPQFFSGQA